MKLLPASVIFGALLATGCSHLPPALTASPDGVTTQAHTASKQWYCEGDQLRQWHCSPFSQAEARLAARQRNHTRAIITEPVTAVLTSQTDPAVTASAVDTKLQTTAPTALADYPADHYTVQLLAARSLETIDDFQLQYPQLKTQQLTLQRSNKPMYLLILDVFPTRQQAVHALKEISPALPNQPWIRRLGPLQEDLQAH